MPIRVVTKEVRYIHELSLTLEYSMSISSPAVPGLTESPTWRASCWIVGRDRLDLDLDGARNTRI